MKNVTKIKSKQQKHKKKPVFKSKKEHVVIVAQEIKFARLLSGNEKKTRDRALKTLKKWLLNCFEKGYEFEESDFTRIWKGLFYAVWMSDKPLVQEELCESIAGILDLFPAEQLRHALLLVKVGLRVLATEWYGIDHHRMDKCLMLVRRYLRGSLRCLLRCGWSLDSCQLYADMLSGEDGILALKTPLYARNATSMVLHVLDCYLEEIAKVSGGDVPAESVSELARPLCAYLCGGEAPGVCAAARRQLTQLLRQSELGRSYADKTRAWQQMGCPEGGPDALELVSDGEGEDSAGSEAEADTGESVALDPRAGRVDVVLPALPVPAARLADMLQSMLATASSKAHKRAKICLLRFQQLSRAEYPLRVEAPPAEAAPAPRAARRAARALAALERKLVADSDELALRGLSRKHRKRLLAASRAGQDIVEAAAAGRGRSAAAVDCSNGDWHVEDTEPEAKRMKNSNDTSNKENVIKHKKQNGVPNKPKTGKVKDSKKHRKEFPNNNVQKNKKTDDKPQKEVNKAEAVVAEGNKKTEESSQNDNADDRLNNIKPVNTRQKISFQERKEKNDDALNNRPTVVLNKVKNDKPLKNAPTVIVNKIKNDKTLKNGPIVPVNKVKNDKTQKNGPTVLVNKVKNDKTQKNGPIVLVNKLKNFQKQLSPKGKHEKSLTTPKKVKFVLKNNSMQEPVDYYKSVRQSPNIPFDSKKVPPKANLKPSTPSPINPFLKKKLKHKRK